MTRAVEQETRKELRLLASPKRIRARVGGVFVADSRRARILYLDSLPRAYAIPVEDLREDLVSDRGDARDHPVLGRIRDGSLHVEGRIVDRAVRYHERGPAAEAGLAGHVTLRWEGMDAWYEEDEEVFVHPRDPYHRIDILQASRHVVVEVEGEKVAESRRPVLLFETGLPVRYYLPHVDVRLDALRPSGKETACPYKGFASYHHVEAGGTRHEDLVWTYKSPFPEAQKIQGLLAFLNERIDLTVDGELQERPRTPWSEPGTAAE